MTILEKFRNLLGAGPLLLLVGFTLEGLTVVIRPWFSVPVPIILKLQIILTGLCGIFFLWGIIWFNCSLNLIKVNLLDGREQLVTHGPFNYVRHPLYSTIILTIPPLMLIWFSDLIFLIPWIMILILSHYLVSIEERLLIKKFSKEYEKYREFVPSLLPFKGAGGKRYRQSVLGSGGDST